MLLAPRHSHCGGNLGKYKDLQLRISSLTRWILQATCDLDEGQQWILLIVPIANPVGS